MAFIASGVTHSAGLTSHCIPSVTRTGSQGNGNQDITESGFGTPVAAFIFAHEGSSPNTSACWSFIDSDNAEGKISRPETGIYRNLSNTTEIIEITDQTTDGMSATGTLITDGIRLGWTVYGSGQTVNMSVLLLK